MMDLKNRGSSFTSNLLKTYGDKKIKNLEKDIAKNKEKFEKKLSKINWNKTNAVYRYHNKYTTIDNKEFTYSGYRLVKKK